MSAQTDAEIARCIGDIKEIVAVLTDKPITETEMVKCMRNEWSNAALRVMREEKQHE
jgi:hypothetical protein